MHTSTRDGDSVSCTDSFATGRSHLDVLTQLVVVSKSMLRETFCRFDDQKMRNTRIMPKRGLDISQGQYSFTALMYEEGKRS